jgi:PEP-CTERM motif
MRRPQWNHAFGKPSPQSRRASNHGPFHLQGWDEVNRTPTGIPMKLTLSLLVAASAIAFNANAAIVDWGTHGALETGASSTPVGSFSDAYLFSLSSLTSLTSSAVSNNLGSVLGLTGGTVTLFADAVGPDPTIGSYTFSGATGSTEHSFGALMAGSYYYVVSGLGTGTMGGFYALASAPAPVPEPATVALMLAGLGIVGFKGRRCRLNQEA